MISEMQPYSRVRGRMRMEATLGDLQTGTRIRTSPPSPSCASSSLPFPWRRGSFWSGPPAGGGFHLGFRACEKKTGHNVDSQCMKLSEANIYANDLNTMNISMQERKLAED